MLPNIDNINQNVAVLPAGGGTSPKHAETDSSAKAANGKMADAYKSNHALVNETPLAVTEKTIAAKQSERMKQQKSTEANAKANQDQVDINLTLSPEERDVFGNVLSSKDKPVSLSEEEKETLKKASERLAKYIEDTAAKTGERRDRVEKALTEWYSRISKRELEGPSDFINLLHSAAMGELDDMWKL